MSESRKTGAPGAARLSVLLPLPFDKPFDYLPVAGASPGQAVLVPLGKRLVTGVVWDAEPAGEVPDARLKPISRIIDAPALPGVLRKFIDWVAGYTMAPLGEVLALAFKPALLEAPPQSMGWLAGEPGKTTAQRQAVLAVLADGQPRGSKALAKAAGVSPAVIRLMADAGLLRPVVLDFTAAQPDPEHAPALLSPAQAAAANALAGKVRAGQFSANLLEGVTGSGKTEVYLEAVAEALRCGRQALILLPEIALSAQFLQRFETRFGAGAVVWHSEISPAARRRAWHEVARGTARVVVGARSALFLPFTALGLIIVDEEHEPAFKQEDGVVYHARDMAVVRARLSDATCILASATPSLESVVNAQAGRYGYFQLPQRHGGAAMPDVRAIDLRIDKPARGQFLSPVLIAAMTETFARGEQVMLFLNRRGYAPLTLCRACGHRMECPNCTAWLVEHRRGERLLCHHCGHQLPKPDTCPACNAAESLVPIGPGVERIADEAALLFPAARTLIMTSDAIAGPVAAGQAARAIEARDIDLIIGTQMVAKGWHFPGLTLVGVVDADLGLAGGDLRASERSVQMLHQVAGRAGRAEHRGHVLLQTHEPEHPVMQAIIAGDLPVFRARELALREPGHWPPYGRLVALIISAEQAHDADQAAQILARHAPHGPGISVLGPAPAPFALLRGRHRRRLLLKASREINVQKLLRAWLHSSKISRAARVDIDIDPISFL
jgi:primosomal protein N' (replication factor Y)